MTPKARFSAKEMREAHQLGREGTSYYDFEQWLQQRITARGVE
jgi:hypothetical protein